MAHCAYQPAMHTSEALLGHSKVLPLLENLALHLSLECPRIEKARGKSPINRQVLFVEVFTFASSTGVSSSVIPLQVEVILIIQQVVVFIAESLRPAFVVRLAAVPTRVVGAGESDEVEAPATVDVCQPAITFIAARIALLRLSVVGHDLDVGSL